MESKRVKTKGEILIRPYIEIEDPCDSHMDGCSCDDPKEFHVVFKLEGKIFKSYDECMEYIKKFENLYL